MKNTSILKALGKGLLSKRNGREPNTPSLDFRLSLIAGNILGLLAQRAHHRNDYHQFNHTYAAVLAGNTEGDAYCYLPQDRFMHPGDSIVFEVPSFNS